MTDQNQKQIKKECRFYEQELPDEKDHVIVVVRDITEYSIVVELLEYDRAEGMITTAEYSKSKRSRQYNKAILEARKMINKKDVCQVLRVDKVQKNMDLSRRKINSEAAKIIQENFIKSKKVQSLFYPLCDQFQKDMIYFYEQIVFPLQRVNEQHIFSIFQQAVFDFDEIIGPLNLDQQLKDSFQKELLKQFTPKPEKIKAIFEITCLSKEGIEDIKRALQEGLNASTQEIKLEINIIGSPKFEISTNCINIKHGKIVVQEGLDRIKQYIEKVGGHIEIKSSPINQYEKEAVLNALAESDKRKSYKTQVENNDEVTDEIKKKQNHLYIIFTFGLMLAISKFIVKESIPIALNETIEYMVLLCVICTSSHCLLIFFVLALIFNSIMLFMLLGIQLQQYFILKRTQIDETDWQMKYLYSILTLTIIFNIIACIVCYTAYKVFKKAYYQQMNSNRNDMQTPLENVGNHFNQSQEPQKQNEKKDFQAFKGEGVKIG